MDTVNTSEKSFGKLAYAVGDACWIHIGGAGRNGLVEGRVVHAFTLPGYNGEQYVVEVDTAIDPILMVRHATSMSEDAAGPILLFRNLPAKKSV